MNVVTPAHTFSIMMTTPATHALQVHCITVNSPIGMIMARLTRQMQHPHTSPVSSVCMYKCVFVNYIDVCVLATHTCMCMWYQT